MSEWRPIETAPKETAVLVWAGGHIYLAAACRVYILGDRKRPAGYEWYVTIGGEMAEYPEDGPSPRVPEPTHWMLLPEPPPDHED